VLGVVRADQVAPPSSERSTPRILSSAPAATAYMMLRLAAQVSSEVRSILVSSSPLIAERWNVRPMLSHVPTKMP
jgi:hypothetical protein